MVDKVWKTAHGIPHKILAANNIRIFTAKKDKRMASKRKVNAEAIVQRYPIRSAR
jgi:hypothetical protein